MSTKAIRQVIDDMAKGRITTKSDWHEALKEVEAIEFAARSLDAGANGPGWESPNVHEAFALMSSIAKDAP